MLEAMFAAYVALLEELAASDAAWEATDRSLIPAAERELIAGVNATAGPLPNDLLHESVFAAAEADPEAIAVIGEQSNLSFGDLTHRSLALAHQLLAVLQPSDRLVAIVMEKGFEQIIAAFAVLESGRAFLPISAAQPDQRIRAILNQAGVRIALTQQHMHHERAWQEKLVMVEVTVETLTASVPPRLPRTASPDDPAYVIYTSGSTGMPKGVTIQHRAARNTIADLTERWAFAPTDRVLWVSSLEFDLSIFDLFGILGVGGTVVLAPPDGKHKPTVWAEAVSRHRRDGLELRPCAR